MKVVDCSRLLAAPSPRALALQQSMVEDARPNPSGSPFFPLYATAEGLLDIRSTKALTVPPGNPDARAAGIKAHLSAANIVGLASPSPCSTNLGLIPDWTGRYGWM